MATLQRDDSTATFAERRRPGRPAIVARTLLPLLRAEERELLPPLSEIEYAASPCDRRLDAGQALVLALSAGGMLWIAIIAAMRAIADLF